MKKTLLLVLGLGVLAWWLWKRKQAPGSDTSMKAAALSLAAAFGTAGQAPADEVTRTVNDVNNRAQPVRHHFTSGPDAGTVKTWDEIPAYYQNSRDIWSMQSPTGAVYWVAGDADGPYVKNP